MPDNVAITAGSGTTIITDEVVGVGHIQVFKQAISTDGSGTLIPADATNGLDVDVTRVIPGTGATELGKAEDDPHISGDVGVMALAVRRDTTGSASGTDGDYSPIQVDSFGRLWAVAKSVEGNTAEDGALTGTPVGVSGRAHSGVPTAMSADNDVVRFWLDRNGAAIVVPQPRLVRVTATPTISTANYVAADQVGGLLTFTSSALASGRAGVILNAVITSRTPTATNTLELWLFQASPTIASSDNAAFDITDANLEAAQLCGVIDFLTADYKASASGAVCLGKVSGGQPSLQFVTSGSANLFGVLVVRGTPTQYTGTTDLMVALTIQQC